MWFFVYIDVLKYRVGFIIDKVLFCLCYRLVERGGGVIDDCIKYVVIKWGGRVVIGYGWIVREIKDN